MLAPMRPTVVSSWLDVLWMVDHSFYTRENSSIAVRNALKLVWLAPTTIPHSKILKYFVLSIHTLNGKHTQPMPQGLKILIEPVSSPSSTLIEVDLTSDINKGSYLSPGFI
jgi:hypothetical protein